MYSSGNSTLSVPVTNARVNQRLPINTLAPANFVEFHNPQCMPIMRSRAQRREAEKLATKMTRVGGPHLHRPQINKMKLVKRIQRQHGPVLSARTSSAISPPALYEEFARAYNYDALTATATDLINQFAAGVHSLSEYLPTLHIGPPMAEAALVSASTKNNKPTDLGSFITSFEKDFDIDMSDGLTGDSSLKGLTVIIGEHHLDAAIQAQIVGVIKRMQAGDGDMLLLEGDDELCKERIEIYQIPSENCKSLEDDSPWYQLSKNLMDLYKKELSNVVNFINSRLKIYPQNIVYDNYFDYKKFIKKYEDLLPQKDQPELSRLMALAHQAAIKIVDATNNGMVERELIMREQIKRYRSSDATNYAVIGGVHLFNLAPDLLEGKLGKVILMMPRAIYQIFPQLSHPFDSHDEL